jgi:release factor glutamine methyltransferase
MNEAELVLTHILDCDLASLYLNKDINLGLDKSAALSSVFMRRVLGEPVQYILGKTEFMGLEFKVDRRVLIPRPETEILAEAGIAFLKRSGHDRPRVLDLGTGSGCIAVSIAKYAGGSDVYAGDISAAALRLAGENALLNKVSVTLLRGDLFGCLEGVSGKFDLIVSNPPYISGREMTNLQRELYFEPEIALNAGGDGLDFYRRIISRAAGYLEDNGALMLEVGYNQSARVKKMFDEKNFRELSSLKDYNGIERVVIAKKKAAEHG